MTPSEQGLAFSVLLKHRTITDNPQGRSPQDREIEAARILSNCSSTQLLEFEEFLNAQGLALHIIDGLDIGIPPRPQVSNKFYILIRKRGTSPAVYFNQRWFIEEMSDKRKARGEDSLETNRVEIIFWFTRLWLCLQWFFYEKISRHPSQVSQYDRAMVLADRFTEVVSEGIEAMGNKGRPENEAGVMYDTLWKGRAQIRTWVKRFLRVMEQAGIIEETSVPGEYRQTLAAAVDMAMIAERELTYLMPPTGESDIMQRSVMLLTGSTLPIEMKGGDSSATD